MTFTCAIDNTEHASLEALHAYIKTAYRVGQKTYWTSYHPRKDLLTGESIPFKDAEQYLAADFTGRVSLKKWLATQPRGVGLTWAEEWLVKRKEAKGLVYAPSQVELRTLVTPTMSYFESVAADKGGYYGITNALGFKPRYTRAPLVFTPLPRNAIIIRDSREQRPINLPCTTQTGALDVGDYAIAQSDYDTGTRIERKSLADFCSSVSGRKVARKSGDDSAFARLERELARAAEANLYVVMMVEAPLNHVYAISKMPHTRHIKASPEYLLHQLRDLLTRYPLSFQAVFVDGRTAMAEKMIRVFQLGAQVREIDLQWILEEGKL